MKYYKDENNQIYAYEDYAVEIKDGLIAITEDEADAILAEMNKPTKEQIIATNKATIKSLIDEATLKIDILNDAVNLGKAKDGDKDKLIDWRNYRVDLIQIDINLDSINWPKKPEL